jgi:hypothetical protein
MKFDSNVGGRRAIRVALAAGLAAALALSLPHRAAAQEPEPAPRPDHHPVCSNATLRGSYGRLGSGIRIAPVNPALTESFVGVGLRTYDGEGGFTGISSSHGQLSPPNRNTPEAGTYEVNADCTGTTTLFITGVPFPIESSFVIVDQGKQVNHVVMSPQPQVVSVVEIRVR